MTSGAIGRLRAQAAGIRLTTLQGGLLAGSLALLMGCLWLLLHSSGSLPETDVEALPLAEIPALASAPRPEAPAQYEAILTRNPFSRTRRASAEPWQPGAPGGQEEWPPEAAGPLQLYGTVVARSPEGSFAVIEADPSRPGPELYRVGDSVATYRLRAIRDGKVILTGPAGELELVLHADSVHARPHSP